MQESSPAFRSSETDMISGVMDNPCILLREDYKPLVWNGFDGEDEFLWIASIDFKAVSKKGQHLNICYQECSDEIPYPLMIVHYTNTQREKAVLCAGRKEYPGLTGDGYHFSKENL